MTNSGDCCNLCTKYTKQNDLEIVTCCNNYVHIDCLFIDSIHLSHCPICKSSDNNFFDSLKHIYTHLFISLSSTIQNYPLKYDMVYNSYPLSDYIHIKNKSVLEYCYSRNILDQLDCLLT